MIQIGDPAPDFELKDQYDASIKLSNFRGKKVLLSFFPFAFSPVCHDEMTCFENDMHAFKGKNVQIIGISVDSAWSQKEFARQLKATFPLLSDFGKEVTKRYGTLRPEGFSDRAYFLIDEHGVVRFAHVMDSPGKKLDNEALLKALQ